MSIDPTPRIIRREVQEVKQYDDEKERIREKQGTLGVPYFCEIAATEGDDATVDKLRVGHGDGKVITPLSEVRAKPPHAQAEKPSVVMGNDARNAEL